VFQSVVAGGGEVRGFCAPGGATLPRRGLDDLTAYVGQFGAKGLVWMRVEEDGLNAPVAKFFSAEQQAAIREKMGAKAGDILFFVADKPKVVAAALGELRQEVARRLEMIPADAFKFCWVVDFPMFEKDEETGQIVFSHNPFSMPQGGLRALEEQDPLSIYAYQYDIVCNGCELSSGAIRFHGADIMYKAFSIAGYSREDVDEKFSGMINAFRTGAPPHGGIAPGIDRMIMLLANERNLREVIAFPMNQRAQDLMMGAPAPVTEKQLKELHINLVAPKETKEK